MPNVDHTQHEYEAFTKDFYKEHPEIQIMGFEEVNQMR